MAFAYNFAIAPRRDNPRVYRATSWQTDVFTLGLNGPDGNYGIIVLDGGLDYRISGRLGDSEPYMLQVFNNVMGPADSKVIGNYVVADGFRTDGEGRFEIIASADQREENWIELQRDARYHWIMLRRNLADWNRDPGDLTIEPMSDPGPDYLDREELDEATMADRIDRAAEFLRFLVTNWNVGIYD